MKKALLALLLVSLPASWCLAQSDSLQVPVNNDPCQSAPCAEPCQPGACAMPCQPVPCAEPFVPKWAVGLSVYRIVDLPGSFYLERLYDKSSLVCYLSTYLYGDLVSEYGYLDSKYARQRFEAGVNYKRLITRGDKLLKIYYGLGPSISYTRSYIKRYNDYDYEYNEEIVSSAGLEITGFIQLMAAKDMAISNLRLRHEISFIPVTGSVGAEYIKRFYSEYKSTEESFRPSYRVTAISTGSVSYSIKYLF